MADPTTLTRTEHKTIVHRLLHRLYTQTELTQQQLAQASGYSQTNISAICRKVTHRSGGGGGNRSGGSERDYRAYKPGRARSRLTPTQWQQLRQYLAAGAKAAGFATAGWTRHRVRGLIEHHFGVRYSLVQVGRILAKLNYTLQRPQVEDLRRSAKQVHCYEQRTLPQLKKS